jgi:hypothetical protein
MIRSFAEGRNIEAFASCFVTLARALVFLVMIYRTKREALNFFKHFYDLLPLSEEDVSMVCHQYLQQLLLPHALVIILEPFFCMNKK